MEYNIAVKRNELILQLLTQGMSSIYQERKVVKPHFCNSNVTSCIYISIYQQEHGERCGRIYIRLLGVGVRKIIEFFVTLSLYCCNRETTKITNQQEKRVNT